MCDLCRLLVHTRQPSTRILRLTREQTAEYLALREENPSYNHWDVLWFVAAPVGSGFMEFIDTYAGAEGVNELGAVVPLPEQEAVLAS